MSTSNISCSRTPMRWDAKIRYETRKSDMSREKPIWVAKIRFETRKSDLGNENAKNAKVSFSATICIPTAAPTAKPPKPADRIAPLIILYSDSLCNMYIEYLGRLLIDHVIAMATPWRFKLSRDCTSDWVNLVFTITAFHSCSSTLQTLIMPRWAEPRRHTVVVVCVCAKVSMVCVCLSRAFLCNG